MTIRSGAPLGEYIHFGLFLAVFVGFGAWFVYDGAYRYRQLNLENARERFPERSDGQRLDVAHLDEHPRHQDFVKLRDRRPTRLAEVREALGEPLPQTVEIEGSDITKYFFASAYGMVEVPAQGELVNAQQMEWVGWGHSHDEIQGQFYWAAPPLLLALWPLYRLIRAARRNIVLDDQGLRYNDVHVAWDEMIAFRDYNPKGWVDLYYDQGDGERMLRLDNQLVARQREIVAAICERKGWEDPLPAEDEPAPESDLDSEAGELSQSEAHEPTAEQPDERDDTPTPSTRREGE